MICRYKIKFISDIEQKIRKLLVNIAVAPFVGVWIEISSMCQYIIFLFVAPFVGVWIEILHLFNIENDAYVAPFVGVWIEIHNFTSLYNSISVAPFVGVWIEICFVGSLIPFFKRSLPSWECGLKSQSYPLKTSG